jgi:anti-anti-sigma factor
MPSDALEIQTIGAATVVCLDSDLDTADAAALARLTRTLSGLLESVRPPLVVLDMSRIQHCKPLVLGLLVKQQAEFRKRSGCLVLAGARPPIRDILRITHVDRVLPVEESAGEAAANIAQHAAGTHAPPPA